MVVPVSLAGATARPPVGVFAVTTEGPGRGKFTQLMADHLLGDKDRHVDLAVVHGDRVTDHPGKNRRGTRPRADHPPLVGLIQRIDLLPQFGVDVRPLFR